nr:response regulator transcription factor [Propionibacterium sp.]
MTRRILIVDDEPQIRTVLRAYLTAEGFEVDEAATGADALNAVRRGPDLVLLDIGLPDLSGLEVLAKIRAASDVYVILVTARAEEVDKLVGLSVGADDYVTKPFSPREVVARVRTVLRRLRSDAPEPAPRGVWRFEGLTIDEPGREVTTDAGPAELSALDFDLLLALASAPGRVFSRAQLLEKVWGYDFYGDERVVDVHIRSMRAALGDDANAPRIIGTVRGVGYKFLLHPLED